MSTRPIKKKWLVDRNSGDSAFCRTFLSTPDVHSTGWALENGMLFDIADIENIGANQPVPCLVFSNSCDAATCSGLSGIAGAFLNAGIPGLLHRHAK